MLRKTFEEPGTRPLPHLREQEKKCVVAFLTISFFYFTGVKRSPLAVLCRSCKATRRVADCYTVYHTWYTCSTRQEKNKGFQLITIYSIITNTQLMQHEPIVFSQLLCERQRMGTLGFAL